MEPTEGHDQIIKKIVGNDDEIMLSVLGKAHLLKWISPVVFRQTILVLTDKNLHQVGIFHTKFSDDEYTKKTGRNTIPVTDLLEIKFNEIPVSPKISVIGAALFILGSAILLGSIIEGSALFLTVGLFIGAVWMMVPGALMLFYARSDGKRFMDIEYADGLFAVSCRGFTEPELENFQEQVSAVIGR